MGRTALAEISLETERTRSVAPKLLLGSARSLRIRYAEALSLPARLLADLPLPPSIGVHVHGTRGVVRIELDPSRAQIARSEGQIAIDADEWRAIAHAAEADRMWPIDFAALCERKQSEPAWRIDAEIALAGAQIDPDEVWSARRVLDRIGAEVLSIDID